MTKIGLEIHCQLTKLESKLFCSCKANYREFEPNHNVCPVCMGLPGSLPRLNQKAVESATSIAMALNCATPEKIAFFRKNYFYPDLPKNFQITQLNVYGDMSVGGEGYVDVEGKKIKIRRIQLEEDPGRLIYEGTSDRTKITLVDYNRAGTPLVEIVTDPDFENPRQVRVFLNILSDLLENLGVAEPGLEGAMRADGNVSQVADILSSDRYYSDLFENAHNESNAKDIANLITTDLLGFIDTREKRETSKVTPQHLADLVNAVNAKTLTRNSSKIALQEIVKSGKSVKELLDEMDLGQVSDSSEIDNIISQIFEEEKQAVQDAKERPETVNFLVGKVMQKTKGKADPAKTLELIKSKLGQ